MPEFTNSLPINLATFGYVHRETHHGDEVMNRCMRDFLYYALHYYHPDEFAPEKLNPKRIEKQNVFGWKLPRRLMWTALHLKSVPLLLKKYHLKLAINGVHITGWLACFNVFLHPPRLSANQAIRIIEKSIDRQEPAAIDITLKHYGIQDHVMFVFAYDKDNLYIIDTHDVSDAGYVRMTDADDYRYIMRLPKDRIRERWTRLGRVWTVTQK